MKVVNLYYPTLSAWSSRSLHSTEQGLLDVHLLAPPSARNVPSQRVALQFGMASLWRSPISPRTLSQA